MERGVYVRRLLRHIRLISAAAELSRVVVTRALSIMVLGEMCL